MIRHALAPPRVRHRRYAALLGLAAACLVMIVAGHQPGHGPEQPRSAAPAGGAVTAFVPEPLPAPGSGTCADRVVRMSLRDRLAQRLMVGVDPRDPGAARDLVRDTHVGGVFISGNAVTILTEPALRAIRTAGPVPTAVAVDDEGGRVQRIDGLVGDLPSARRMGSMPVEDVHALANKRGRQLRDIGISIDFAPVLDIADQPDGAVIGDRSFSADPQVVTTHAGAWAAGLREAAVTPVFKHFPGHGRALGDSHKTLPTTPPLDALRALDLKPYQQLLGAEQAAVMVGHLNVPGLTDGTPASLSPNTYRLLRADLGFTGVTVTDDLGGMLAVTDRYGIVDAVALALGAGADIALWTSSNRDVHAVLDNLVRETQSGKLPVADSGAATARILQMKGVCNA